MIGANSTYVSSSGVAVGSGSRVSILVGRASGVASTVGTAVPSGVGSVPAGVGTGVSSDGVTLFVGDAIGVGTGVSFPSRLLRGGVAVATGAGSLVLDCFEK